MNPSEIIAGAAALAEFGVSEPVRTEVGAWRASVCAACPLNRKSGWWEKFGGYAVTLLGVRKWLRDLGRVTPDDWRLHVCAACNCPLKLKVWCPPDIIKKHLTEEIKANLHVHCWMRIL